MLSQELSRLSILVALTFPWSPDSFRTGHYYSLWMVEGSRLRSPRSPSYTYFATWPNHQLPFFEFYYFTPIMKNTSCKFSSLGLRPFVHGEVTFLLYTTRVQYVYFVFTSLCSSQSSGPYSNDFLISTYGSTVLGIHDLKVSNVSKLTSNV